jgi:hypothetical protein
MWSKINKLTSMVYPQFTEGRKLVSSDGANAVYAPFSQSISAAPLVRVRIGDLIKSNYSKFGLARLFGLYYEDTKLNNYKTTGKEPQLSRSDAEKRFLSPGNTYRPQGSLDLLGESVELALGYVLKIKNIKDNTATCTLERGTGDDTPTETNEKLDEFNAELQIAVDRLSPSKETEKRILSEIKKTEAPENSSYDDQVDKFMIDNDPNNGNAIARSFRTVGGKGLPGFIESLAFDWYDKTTWTTDEGEGRKAPKMCKVTISFSPFHDITPGLDHKGFNRAPVYPVGPLATKKV